MRFKRKIFGTGNLTPAPRQTSFLASKPGLSMVELIGVMIVIAIITTLAGVSISRNVKRSNREAVVNELQVFNTSLADAYYDLGSPAIDPSATGAEDDFKRWLTNVQDSYLAVAFDWTTLQPTTNGFTVEAATPLDVFESRYKFWFITSPNLEKYAMVASGGEDGLVDSTGYSAKAAKDDIVLVFRPKT